MEPSNEALVLACRRGDERAWEQLVERYQRLVWSIPRRAGLNDEQAADIFQQVFVALVEQLQLLRDPERIGAWLATTTRRATWRQVARTRNIQLLDQVTDDETTPQLPSADPLPDEVVLQLEMQHRVRLGVQALDERCRTLLELLFYHHEPPPYTEIAGTLGIHVGSIGPTRARCLEKLRRLLDADDA